VRRFKNTTTTLKNIVRFVLLVVKRDAIESLNSQIDFLKVQMTSKNNQNN
jgi:hypothetical protein